MIRTFSLQAKPEERNRSFYAFADHKPPPRYQQKPPQARPRGSVDQNRRSHHSQSDGHFTLIFQNTKRRQQQEDTQETTSTHHPYQQLSSNREARGARGQNHGRKRRQQPKACASPVLSEQRTRSHFGASTQMIIEDGSASVQAMNQEGGGNNTPFLRREDARNNSPGITIDNQNKGLLVVQQRQQQSNLNDYRTKKPQIIKTFNRQLTVDYHKYDEDKLSAVAEDVGQGSIDFRQRVQRGSLVSETLDHPDKPRYQHLPEHTTVSAELLTKLQLDTSGGKEDQVSELRRMEIQMESLKLARLHSTALSAHGDNDGTYCLPSVQDPQSPPLNVVLPQSVKTGFINSTNAQSRQQSVDASDHQNNFKPKKKIRAKTAQNRRNKNSNRNRRENQIGEGPIHSNVVVMNAKTMSVGQGATATGIVSLYNKGFVPKKTGKVNKKSQFGTFNKNLYQVGPIQQTLEEPSLQINEEQQMAGDTLQTMSDERVHLEVAQFRQVSSGAPSLNNNNQARMDQIIEFREDVDQRNLNQQDQVRADRLNSQDQHTGDSKSGILGSGTNVRSSNSQLYHRQESSSDDLTLTDFNTAQDKKSFQASELVLKSLQGFVGDGVIDYGSKDQPANIKITETMIVTDTKIEKTHFKLPRTQVLDHKTALTPKALNGSVVSADFGTNQGGAQITGDDHESREMTEMEENVMQPINLLEKTSSGEINPKKVGLLLISDENTRQNSYVDLSQNQKPPKEKQPRVQSANRKSVHSKQSFSNTDRQKSVGKCSETQQRAQTNRTGTGLKENAISKLSSSKGPLNKDLTQQQSFEMLNSASNYRQANNQSKTMVDQQRPKTHSSLMLSKNAKSPNQTSMSHLVGTSLQSRPLIGHQLVRDLVEHSQKKSQNTEGARSKSAKSGIQPNKQIYLEVQNLEQGTPQLIEEDNKQQDQQLTVFKVEKALVTESRRGPQTPRVIVQNSLANFTGAMINQQRLQSGKTLNGVELNFANLHQQHQHNMLQSDAVLVSDHAIDHAQTLEQLASYTQIIQSQQEGAQILQTIQPAKPLITGISSRTLQKDAHGNVKHVFLINQTSQVEMKASTAEKFALNSKRSKEGKRIQKRRKRPSSSRLRKRGKFDLMNEKQSNGEDVATVMGGSTSRQNQHSIADLGGRKASDQTVDLLMSSVPRAKKYAHTFRTKSHAKSSVDELDSDSSQSQGSLKEQKSRIQEQLMSFQNAVNSDLAQQQSQSVERQQFTIEANNMKSSTLPVDERHGDQKTHQSMTIETRHAGNLHNLLLHSSAANSINDYLKNEEISKVRIMDLRSSAILSSQEIQNNTIQMVQTSGVQQTMMVEDNPSQLTVYRIGGTGDQQQHIESLGTGGPPTSNHFLPINAMYSHMSQRQGTESIQTTSGLMTGDPKLEVQSPFGHGGTTFLSPMAEQAALNNNSLPYPASANGGNGSENQVENPMMVVTKIRSKLLTSHKENPALSATKVTIDFNEERGADKRFMSQDYGQLDSQFTEIQMREQQENLNPQFLSSQTKLSQISQDRTLNPAQFMASQYTPDHLKDQMEPTIRSEVNSNGGGPHQQQQYDQFPTVALVLSETQSLLPQDGLHQHQHHFNQTQQDAFSLSGTIKQNQTFLRQVQLLDNVQQSNTRTMKQHELLGIKERSVIPMSIATVPEKTQFKKRLFKEHVNPQLGIIGQQTHTITMKQFDTHVQKTAAFYRDLQNNQTPSQDQEVMTSYQDTNIAGQQDQRNTNNKVSQGNQAGGPLTIQEDGQLDSLRNLTAQLHTSHNDDRSESNKRVDRGLQSNAIEDFTSCSNGSRSGHLMIAEQSRKTGGGFNMNIETCLRGTSSQDYLKVQQCETEQMHTSNQKRDESALSLNPNQLANQKLFKMVESQAQRSQYFNHERAPSHEVSTVKMIPVNQRQHIMTTQLQSSDVPYIQSPLRGATDENTELSYSPYTVNRKPKLASANRTFSHTSKNQRVQGTQANFSNRITERNYLSSENGSNQNTNSCKIILPNQDLAELADINDQRSQQRVTVGGQQLIISPFGEQQQPTKETKDEDRKVADGQDHPSDNKPLISINPPQNTIGVGVDIETVKSVSNRGDGTQTMLLQLQSRDMDAEKDREREKSQSQLHRDDLRYSSVSNAQSNQQRSAKQLQAAMPASFDVQITNVGSQAMTANQSRQQLGSSKNIEGDYQGAPPNHFMRKASQRTSSFNYGTQRNQREALKEDYTTTPFGATTQYRESQRRSNDDQQPRLRSQVQQSMVSNKKSQLSLAVETRNLMTGTRQKIVKSAIQSQDIDMQSNQTQTEVGQPAGKDGQTMTIDYHEYSSAHKLPSDHSFHILDPRGGIGYQQDGATETKNNSIQVTIGRVTQPRSGSSQEKYNSGSNNYNGMNNKVSQFTLAQQESVDLKVQQSKSKVFESLGSQLFQVGQKSLAQLGVSSQISFQQSFNNIRNTVKLQNEQKDRQLQYDVSQQQSIEQGPSKSLRCNASLQRLQQLAELSGGMLESIVEKPKAKKRNKGKVIKSSNLTLTRQGFEASQHLLDFSANQTYQLPNRNLATNSSGVFDPKSEIIQSTWMRNNNQVQREEPDYSKKSTIQNMMAKRQKASQLSNIPLPILTGFPLQQSTLEDINSRESLTAKSTIAQNLLQSNRRYGEQQSNSSLHKTRTIVDQNTISAMDDFEQQIENAHQQYNGFQQTNNEQRPSSHSTYAKRPPIYATTSMNMASGSMIISGKPSSKPTRPISSGIYASTKRTTNNQTPSMLINRTGAASKQTNGPALGSSSKVSRPLTAQNRRVIVSAKSGPSLAKGSSGQYRTNHAQMAAGTVSETQASSAFGGKIQQHNHTQSGYKPRQRILSAPRQANIQTHIPQAQFLHQSGSFKEGSFAGANLISRNQSNEYATTSTAGLGSKTILSHHQANGASLNANFVSNAQLTGATRKTRPFSGVQTISKGRSLVRGYSKPQVPSVTTSVNNIVVQHHQAHPNQLQHRQYQTNF